MRKSLPWEKMGGFILYALSILSRLPYSAFSSGSIGAYTQHSYRWRIFHILFHTGISQTSVGFVPCLPLAYLGVTVSQGSHDGRTQKKRTERPFCPLAILAGEAFRRPEGLPMIQSRISISLPQQKGTTSPAFTWTVLLQVTQYTSVS